jgi:chromosome segregation ATPase
MMQLRTQKMDLEDKILGMNGNSARYEENIKNLNSELQSVRT